MKTKEHSKTIEKSLLHHYNEIHFYQYKENKGQNLPYAFLLNYYRRPGDKESAKS